MAILNSKRLTALQEENEELKSQIREIYEKKWTKARLDEVLNNARSEIVGIKDEKLQLSAILDDIKIEIGSYNNSRKDILKEIDKLKRNKIEEQNNLSKLRSQIILFESKLKDLNKIPLASNPKLAANLATAEKRYKELSSNNKSLEEKISNLSNRLYLLHEQEKEITDKISSKKNEFEQLKETETNRLKNEISRLEEKIELLRDTESKITVDMENKIDELKKEEASFKEKVAAKLREFEIADSQLLKIRRDKIC